MHYKDINNQLYFVESSKYAYLLPTGVVSISDSEADAIRNPAKPLSERKAKKLFDLNRITQEMANQATSSYPEFETKTWEDQRREATAWQENNTAATPYIDALSTFRGIPRIEYLQRTILKINSFTAFSTKIVGLRQKYADMIDAAADESALNAIVFNFA